MKCRNISCCRLLDFLKECCCTFQDVEDWKFVAMVFDRFFFVVFTSASIIGTFGILLQAPTIYDDRIAITSETAPDNLC